MGLIIFLGSCTLFPPDSATMTLKSERSLFLPASQSWSPIRSVKKVMRGQTGLRGLWMQVLHLDVASISLSIHGFKLKMTSFMGEVHDFDVKEERLRVSLFQKQENRSVG